MIDGDLCVYMVKRTSSKRIHENTIDINIDSVRIFLSNSTAMKLIDQMLKALEKEEKGCDDFKRSPVGGTTETPVKPGEAAGQASEKRWAW